MDPLQWMGAVRMRVQTADKNITIIHMTPVHQLKSWSKKKKSMFVRNKSIIKCLLTLNHHFSPKYESRIHNNSSSSKKVYNIELFRTVFTLFVPINIAWAVYISLLFWTSSLKKAILWIENSYFSLKQRFEVKNILMIFSFLYIVSMFI